MGNIICENYYCQDVSIKPEWFSEESWNISYILKRLDKPLDKPLDKSLDKPLDKPFIINKGLLRFINSLSSETILSKKLMIHEDIKNISIPLNFRHFLCKNNSIDITIYFSKELPISDISTIFFITLSIFKKYMIITKSYDKFNKDLSKKNTFKKIKLQKTNLFKIEFENYMKMLIIREKELIYLPHENEIYLSLYIKIKKDLIPNKEFIELHFE